MWYAPEEYHDSRTEGPKSAPVFWRHSLQDIVARAKSVGFSQVELVDVFITTAQIDPAKVILAIK